MIGDLDTHDTLCRELANGSGCAVVSVDYRSRPSTASRPRWDDAIAGGRAGGARGRGAEAGRGAHRRRRRQRRRQPRRGGGDRARDAGEPPFARQLLIYPATDQHRTAPSHASNGQGYLLTRDTMDYFTGHYHPRCAPPCRLARLAAAAPRPSRLPPALVLTAGYDPLRDEGRAYAQKLSEAGTRATHLSFERQIHGFILMGKVLAEANDAVRLWQAEAARRAGRRIARCLVFAMRAASPIASARPDHRRG